VRRTFGIVSLNVSARTGTTKTPVERVELREDHGIVGDAHAGPGNRQVSLLGIEDVDSMRTKLPELEPGDFAENVTTRGIDLPALPLGTRLEIGEALLEVTKIGKECHRGCEILRKTGDCVMPRRGIFARVVRGGEVRREDTGAYDL